MTTFTKTWTLTKIEETPAEEDEYHPPGSVIINAYWQLIVRADDNSAQVITNGNQLIDPVFLPTRSFFYDLTGGDRLAYVRTLLGLVYQADLEAWAEAACVEIAANPPQLL